MDLKETKATKDHKDLKVIRAIQDLKEIQANKDLKGLKVIWFGLVWTYSNYIHCSKS